VRVKLSALPQKTLTERREKFCSTRKGLLVTDFEGTTSFDQGSSEAFDR
jgi:hypothetical protein